MLDHRKLKDVLWLLEIRETSRKVTWSTHLHDEIVIRCNRQIVKEIDAELERMLIDDTAFPEVIQ